VTKGLFGEKRQFSGIPGTKARFKEGGEIPALWKSTLVCCFSGGGEEGDKECSLLIKSSRVGGLEGIGEYTCFFGRKDGKGTIRLSEGLSKEAVGKETTRVYL